MRARSALLTLLIPAAAAACAAPAPVTTARRAPPPALAADTEVRNIIFLVADGAGPGLWSVGAYATSDLAVKGMSVAGMVDTRSASHRVTDSAAAASAFATGQRVTNRTLSMGHDCPMPQSGDTTGVALPAGCRPLESWFQIAREKGKATGLVTTTYVVDATPAAFVTHSPSRYLYDMLAERFASAELDVLLGGGRSYFDGATRNDGRDLLGPMCARSDCVFTGEALSAYRPTAQPLVGLFAPKDMDALEPRPAGLPQMVEAALAKLAQSPNGFVAVFESESTDNATHGNAPLEVLTDYILEFDRTVAMALEFARIHPGTLVIATGDHESGGLALVEAGRGFELKYTTRGHSAAPVPLFAEGPLAERFGGYRENHEIGQRLLDIVREW